METVSQNGSATTAKAARRRDDRPGPRANLDQNHSHFILVDAGCDASGKFGKEIKLRAMLEDSLCAEAGSVDAHECHLSRVRPLLWPSL